MGIYHIKFEGYRFTHTITFLYYGVFWLYVYAYYKLTMITCTCIPKYLFIFAHMGLKFYTNEIDYY